MANDLDFSAVPEQFHTAEGGVDLKAMRESFDRLKGAIPPESPDGYELRAPNVADLDLPEGFDGESFELQVDENDPALAALRKTAHHHGLGQAAVDDLLRLWGEHQIRTIGKDAEAALAEMKALGPNAQSRIDSLTRVVRARLPREDAEALLGDIRSADALRAVESLLSGSGRQPNGDSPGGKPHLGELSIDERLALASAERRNRDARRRR